jgi:hypothetical protein
MIFLTLASIAGAQTQPVVRIDPAGEHSRVYLSSMDETTRATVAGKFDFEAPRNQKYKWLALLLTNASGKSIIAITIRWTAISAAGSSYYDSSVDSLHLSLPGGGGEPGARVGVPGTSGTAQIPVSLGKSWSSEAGNEVLKSGGRMIVAPGMFLSESRPGGGWGTVLENAMTNAESISATLDTVVLQDGEVLGPDASRTVDSFLEFKATIVEMQKAIEKGERDGLDGAEIIKHFAGAQLKGPDNDPNFAQLRRLVSQLGFTSDWRQRLQKLSAIQLPNFHR